MRFSTTSQVARPHGSAGARVAIALAAALIAAGCSQRVVGVMEPYPEPVEGTNEVQIIVATTRSIDSQQPAMMFTGDRDSQMNFAEVTVSIPPDANRKEGEVQWPKKLPGDPQREFVTVESEFIDRDTAIRRFHEHVGKTHDRHVMVFVHGYNNRFEDAVYRFAQIVHDSEAEVVPVLFTWPSRGKLVAYGYDRESTNYSRDALEALLTYLSRDKSVSEISILAHSMGNWLTLESLRQMAIRNGHIVDKVQDVILAAPDVDVDVFRTQIAAFGEPRPRFTVFVSQKDKALRVSRRVWGSTVRLGAINVKDPIYRDEMAREGIAVVDLTNEKTDDRMNHATFAESPKAVHMIGAQLAGGQELNTYEASTGEVVGAFATNAGASIGSAAGLLVSAPVAVLDPKSRDTYDDQIANFNQSIEDTLTIDSSSGGSGDAKPVDTEGRVASGK